MAVMGVYDDNRNSFNTVTTGEAVKLGAAPDNSLGTSVLNSDGDDYSAAQVAEDFTEKAKLCRASTRGIVDYFTPVYILMLSLPPVIYHRIGWLPKAHRAEPNT